MAQSDDSVWQKLLKSVSRIDQHKVNVGVLSTKGGGASEPGSALTLVELATIHEFGSAKAGIPERSFIRATFEAYDKKLAAFQGKLAKLILANKITPERAIEMLGVWGAAQVKNFVMRDHGVTPELKASTTKAKGSDVPLVDTGRLINSVSYEVVK